MQSRYLQHFFLSQTPSVLRQLCMREAQPSSGTAGGSWAFTAQPCPSLLSKAPARSGDGQRSWSQILKLTQICFKVVDYTVWNTKRTAHKNDCLNLREKKPELVFHVPGDRRLQPAACYHKQGTCRPINGLESQRSAPLARDPRDPRLPVRGDLLPAPAAPPAA